MSVPRRRTLHAFLLLAAGACTDGPFVPSAESFEDEPAPDPQPDVVAFVGVHVVSMEVDDVLPDRTVVVRRDRIEAVGPTGEVEVPDDAFVIEGRGRYLMPGLADMHVHLTSGTFEHLRNDLVLFLANGVTTVRVMWGSLGALAERERIENREVVGPTLLVASPGLDAPGGTWTASTPPVATPQEARDRVRAHARAEYDFIKVYNDLDRATYDAIVDEAAAHDIPVVGHVPWRVGLEHVQDAGQRTSEHLIGLRIAAADRFTAGDPDVERVRALLTRSAAVGLWHTPTVTVDALSSDRVRRIRAGDELPLVSPGMRAFFENGFHHGLADEVARREDANHRAMIRVAAEVDAGLLVGTDAGFGWILPGYSIHDELDAFERAGLTRSRVLSASTAAAARSVGQEGVWGRVASGLRADLVLVTADPLVTLDALREVSGVMVRGRWLSRSTLQSMLEGIRAAYGG